MKFLEKKNLTDLVVTTLQDEIRDDRLKPGQKLPSIYELSRALNVGTGTIREGLQQLQSMGIIEMLQGKGSFVRSDISYYQFLRKSEALLSLSKYDMINMLEARKLIERETAKLAARNMCTSGLKELDEILSKAEIDKTEIESFSEDDISFHLKIAEYSRNSTLLVFLKAIQSVFTEEVKAVASVEEARQRALRQHRDIYNALKNKDEKEASRRMGKHIYDVERMIRGYKKENNK